MKFNYLLGILSFALISQASGVSLTLSPSSASVSPNGGTYSFFVNESHSSLGLENGNWNWSFSTRNGDWSGGIVTSPEPNSQSGDQTFTYYVPPNLSTSSRTQRIRVIKDGGIFGGDITRYFQITQAGLTPTLSLSSSARTFSSTGGEASASVLVRSNTTWKWSGKPSWVNTTEPTSQSRDQTFSYSVSANTSNSSRSATLTFTTTSGGNTQTRTHRITQEGAPYLSVVSEDGFPVTGGDSNITVSSNTSWRWSGKPSWLSTTEATNQSGTQTFSYTVQPNTSTNIRIATLTFTTTGAGNRVTRTHRITQDPAPSLSLTSSSRDFSPTSGSYSFTVSSNTTWRWSGKPSWVSTGESTSQSNTQTFSYNVQPNTSTSSRSATLTFTTTGPGITQTRTHRITQDGAAPTLTLSSSSRSYSSNAGSNSFTVSSNTRWSWSGKPDWVTSTESSSQSGNQSFSYSVKPNDATSSRTATLTFTATSGRNTVTRIHRITQSGAAPILSLSSSSRSFSANGGSSSFTVSSNTNWSWNGKPSWVTANESSSQTGNQSFSYTVQPNTSTSSRSVTLFFRTTGTGNTITRTYNISQSAASATLALDGTTHLRGPEAGSYGVSVSSNTTWRWSDNATWITSGEPINQSRDQLFNYSLQPNPSINPRSGRITFITTVGPNAKTRYLNITQEGAQPSLTLSSPSKAFSAAGGSFGFSVTSNTNWQWSGKPFWVKTTESPSQSGNQSFSYTVEPNTKTVPRSATLTFSTTTGDIVVKALYTITQEAAEDTLPPVITLVGPPTMTIEANPSSNYIDEGATCMDEVDGFLNQAVEVSGDVVNLSRPGTYIIRYNCQDAAGNEATEVIRTVHVKDTLPPVIILDGNDTLDIEAGFPYEEPGANAEDSLDGNVTVNMDHSGVDTNVVGSHTVTYTATDAAGNVAELTRTVNVILTQAPTITSLAGVGAPKALSAVSITFASYLNAGYVIECSRDLENWEVVSEIQGEAQSTTITIDEPILDGGAVFYRVGVQISQEE